jgi:hypothetical protein
MANTLLKTGITTGESVEAWHVTQSIDAFSGLVEYDITLSGSFTLQNGTQQNGAFAVSDASGLVSFTGSYSDLTNTSDAFNSFTSSYNTGSFTGSFTGDGSGLTGITASSGPNFANTNLTFTGNRTHNTNGNLLQITTDNGGKAAGFIYFDNTLKSEYGYSSSYTDWRTSSVDHYLLGVKRLEILSSETVFNNPGGDYDFRIESDTNPNMLFIDAGLNRIGIAKSSPNSTLDISGSVLVTGSLTTTNFRMTDGASSGYLLQSDGSGNASWVPSSGGGGLTWVTRTNTDSQLYNIPSTNYGIINRYDNNTYSEYVLPATCSIGDVIEIIEDKPGSSKTYVRANTGQTILVSNYGTTTSGGLFETVNTDNVAIKLVCITANTKWAVTNYFSDYSNSNGSVPTIF